MSYCVCVCVFFFLRCAGCGIPGEGAVPCLVPWPQASLSSNLELGCSLHNANVGDSDGHEMEAGIMYSSGS